MQLSSLPCVSHMAFPDIEELNVFIILHHQ